MKKSLAILLPAYNEEKTVSETINDFLTMLKNNNHFSSFKIYVYDNNSDDNTAKIVRKIAKKNKHIIYRFERIQGKGAVVRQMFRQINADIYVMADADTTYPAKHIFELTEKIEKGYDLVNGDRLSTTYNTENKRKFHNFGNDIVKNLINKLFKANIPDILTGYRAFSKKFVKLFPSTVNGFDIETEITIFALENNFKISNIPILYKDRPIGSHSKLNTIVDGLKVLKLIFNLFRTKKPLLFFSSISLILFICGLIPFILVCIMFWQTGEVRKIPTLICSCFVFLSSIQSFFTGLILDSSIRQNKEINEILLKQNH